MKVYTYSEARQKLATVLTEACSEGEIRIRRNDGQVFALRPVAVDGSPLDVEGVDLGLTRDEIVAAVREGRRE